MEHLLDKEIIYSWSCNALPWLKAIKNEEITSRIEVTNQAILESITRFSPIKVLDVGCGEGWLVRVLSDLNMDVLGVDATKELIGYARKFKQGRYKVLSYDNLTNEIHGEKFDVVVANFSLFGNQSVIHLFNQVSLLLNIEGKFIVQTLNPKSYSGNTGYKDGWREGSWEGFSEKFSNPAPWFFRTIGSWISLFEENGLVVKEIKEPMGKLSTQPASIIFIGEMV